MGTRRGVEELTHVEGRWGFGSGEVEETHDVELLWMLEACGKLMSSLRKRRSGS